MIKIKKKTEIIIGVACNCTMNNELDRYNCTTLRDIGQVDLKLLMDTYDPEEIWRRRYPGRKQFLWKGMVFSNYRPVSVLPLFSKILEHLMYTRLLSFINKNKLLYSYQFGFRRGHSPDLALICLVDRISNALENGEYVLGLFLDFVTVNHDILFTKLECLGIRDTPLQWFKSYLSNREQYVIYNETCSSYKTISCGVPQGSMTLLMYPMFYSHFFLLTIPTCLCLVKILTSLWI